ncbi:hypothetical protein ACF0H5_009347 [Mactra antiquata]
MKRHFYSECKMYMHANPGRYISRYEVAKLTARPYAKAFSPENIVSSYKKAGIYPFNAKVIVETQTAPAEIYPSEFAPSTRDIKTSSKTNTPIVSEKSILEIGNDFLERKKSQL